MTAAGVLGAGLVLAGIFLLITRPPKPIPQGGRPPLGRIGVGAADPDAPHSREIVRLLPMPETPDWRASGKEHTE